jgi:flavin reductase (DIM6/NTAB) family NADH-FMN oxidoreductase RutF
MDRRDMKHTEHFEAVIGAMMKRGLLLSAYDPDEKPNAMTIGWGTLGAVWGMPIWVVLVRPSRYTYECIEHSQSFAVNVPGPDLEAACELCGTRSGRDLDKLAAANLTAERGRVASVPTLGECPVVYECQVVHCNDVLPARLVREVQTGAYASGDYHRVYFGKVLYSGAAADAAERLG